MPRPCHADHPDPPATAAACPWCREYGRDARYRQLCDGAPFAAPAPARAPLSPVGRAPCRHRGEPLTGDEKNRLGLRVVVEWRRCGGDCDHRGRPVTACGSCGGVCGSRCPGYEPDDDP